MGSGRDNGGEQRDGEQYDVAIAGGGLAGLTLALQLRRRANAEGLAPLRIVVIERTQRPLPTACHKVGESSIEVGSHYLDTVVGLREYLDQNHLKKNGLRFFCGAPELEVGTAN